MNKTITQQSVRTKEHSRSKFPLGTNTLQLLSSIKPIEKQEEARKQIISKDARVVYLATKEEGMTMPQAIEEVNKRGIVLIPNKDIDERLNGKEEIWIAEEQFYPCWSGTLLIYAPTNKEFRKEISFEGMRVQIPEEWRRKKNCAIVCNHPNFTIGNDGLITLKNAALIENFPTETGWYLPEQNFGIPCGKLSNEENPEARKLWSANAAFIGLLTRGDYGLGNVYVRHNVYAFQLHSYRCGVLGYDLKKLQK